VSAPVLLLGVLAVLWFTNQLDGTLNRLGAPGLTHACVEADSTFDNALRCAIYKGEHTATSSAASNSGQGGFISSTQPQMQSANDAVAKSNLRTAQVAEETYATDNNGHYAADTLDGTDSGPLAQIEPTLKTSPYVTATGDGATGYTLVATAASGDVFTISESDGTLSRTCSGSDGGCVSGTW
jgi:hypothetical protein